MKKTDIVAELETLHAMLMDPEWTTVQANVARWRRARMAVSTRPEITVPVDEEFLRKLLRNVSFGLIIGPRVSNLFLYGSNGQSIPSPTVRDLVRMEEHELLRAPNIGRRTVARIKVVLAEHGLYLGMDA